MNLLVCRDSLLVLNLVRNHIKTKVMFIPIEDGHLLFLLQWVDFLVVGTFPFTI